MCKTEELVEKCSFSFSADYSLYESIKRLFPDFHISDLNEDYAENISASGSIWLSEKDAFCERIKNLSAGRCCVLCR